MTLKRRSFRRKALLGFQGLLRDIAWKIADWLGPAPKADPQPVSEEDHRHFDEHGWVVLKGAADPAEIDRLRVEIERFRARAGGGRDRQGHGVRIGLLHAVNRCSLNMALNVRVRSFLARAFGGEPVLFGSLTFDVGSEQEPHIDAAFFATEPQHGMAGCWFALEDIHPDSGPLFYVDGSHRWERQWSTEVLAKDAELDALVKKHRQSGKAYDLELSERVYKGYIALLARRLEEKHATLTPALIKKGDVLIWHAWLVHGGSPRLNPALTRRSMVAHFIRADARFWDQHRFFLHGDALDEASRVRFGMRNSRRGRYVKYWEAVTFPGGDGHYKA